VCQHSASITASLRRAKLSISLEFGTSVFIGGDGTPWPAPTLATIDDPKLPCAVVLVLSMEKGELVLDEITYRRRPAGLPITGATIAAAPWSKMIEIAMDSHPRAQYPRAKAEFLDEVLGIECQEGDDIDAMIAEAFNRLQPVPDDVAKAWKRVEAQDPAKLRRSIRSQRVKRRKLNDPFLVKVLKVRDEAKAEGKSPAREVARRLDPNWNPKISPYPKTAQRWIRDADRKSAGGAPLTSAE
jgi:hypothetical protein